MKHEYEDGDPVGASIAIPTEKRISVYGLLVAMGQPAVQPLIVNELTDQDLREIARMKWMGSQRTENKTYDGIMVIVNDQEGYVFNFK